MTEFESREERIKSENETPNRWITSPSARTWIYGVATAGLGVLAVYGVIDSVQAEAWGQLAAAAVNLAAAGVTGLAARNTPGR